MLRVTVIGGGITGLSAAYALSSQAKERGVRLSCTVVEQESLWGGKVRTLQEDGLVLEFGPDALLRRKPWATDLCRRLGIGDKLVPTKKSGAFVRWDGQLLPLPEGLSFLVPTRLEPFIESPLFSMEGKLRLLGDYTLPASPPEGDESLGAFVRRRMGEEALERLAEPLLSGIYAGDIDRLSVMATFPQLRSMEKEHGGLLKAALAQKKGAPETPRQTTGAAESPFVSLDGGLGTLIDALVAALHDQELLLGVGVREILRGDAQGATPARYRVSLEDGRVIAADAVVLTTPTYVQARLLHGLAPEAAEALRSIEYASVAGAILVYPKSAVPGPLNGTGYIVPRSDGGPVTACTWASDKWGHVSDLDTVVLRLHFGKAGREDVTGWDDEQLIRAARTEVERTMGVREAPARTLVYRWPLGMPQYNVGHLDRVRRIEESLYALPGVYATGAAFHGIGVPDCVRQGEEVAAAVLAEGVKE